MKKIATTLLVMLIASMMVFAGGSSDKAASSAAPASSGDASIAGATEGTNTFVEGGTEMALWTFQELHVGFWTQMADEWNAQYPDRAINLTVSSAESGALHNRLLIACQAGVGTPDIADIEIGRYGAFLRDGYLLPINDAVEPYQDDVIMSRITMYGDGTGNWYGIDFHLGESVAYYNMDIMNAAGVDPADIVTWDDYLEAGKIVLLLVY